MIMIMNSNTTTTTTTNTLPINNTTNGNIINSGTNNNDQQSQQQQQTKSIVNNVDDDDITTKELGDLLNFFSGSSSSPYRNRDNNVDSLTTKIEEQCIRLISKDYSKFIVIKNDKGQLSTSYPSKIVIPEIEIINNNNNHYYKQHVNKDKGSVDSIDRKIMMDHFNGEQQKYPSSNTVYNGNNNQVPIDEVDNMTINQRQQKKLINDKNFAHEKFDVHKLKDLIGKARVARCRARFPIPAILYKNKYICRSATLSSAAEIFGRSVLDYTLFNDKKNYTSSQMNCENIIETIVDDDDDDFIKANYIENNNIVDDNDDSPPIANRLNIADSTKLFSHFRNQDIKLLKYLNVKLICDLMLEKKKVKFGMNVTSSEKADKKNRYSDFNILSLPYPGCEFFREYRDNSYSGEGLIYDWNQDFVDAEFGFDNSIEISKILNLNFNEYRSWDVIRLTQNYIKLMLYFLKEFDSSLLIHCISGWDRTPLFISLLRLTLWADGEIHKSLNAVEICYLTVAYDWLLFGHDLNDRLNKGEEIMFFCFQFLKFITCDEFSIDQIQQQQQQRQSDQTPIAINGFENDEEKMVRKISTDSFTLYEDFVIENIPNNVTLNSNSSIGSSSSLNRNSMVPVNTINGMNNKSEDSYSLVSTFEFEQQTTVTTTTNIKDSSSSSSNNLNIHDNNLIDNNHHELNDTAEIISSSSSQPSEMIATLTLDDVDDTVNHFGSPPPQRRRRQQQQQQNGSFNNNDNNFCEHSDLHSSTQPVQIPNSNNHYHHHHHNHHHHSDQSHSLSNGSLCRSDSWQFVSEASSIIDNHSILNQHFSSPESFSSLANANNNNNNNNSSNNRHHSNSGNKKCQSPLNFNANSSTLSSSSSLLIQSNNNHRSRTKRGERLLEVRSLFNSAYMSINSHHHNNGGGGSGGGLVTNFMDQLCRTVNI
nr:myotubularin-related protein 14-like [Dermatophagoides farinae]